MKRFVELSCYTTYDDDYDFIQVLTVKIGVMSLTIKIVDAVRLKILEFFAAPNKHGELKLEIDGLFCPSVRLDGKHVYLPLETEDVMDTFGVKRS